ncbi:MAG TPA: hypothetical protein VIL96_00565 [Gaiellaceae bacterium]
MRKFAVLAVLTGALAFPAFGIADPGGQSGTYCGASANGCDTAFVNTECSGHGSFGAFGKDNNFAGGANGQLTGYFNSALCGNGNGGTAP